VSLASSIGVAPETRDDFDHHHGHHIVHHGNGHDDRHRQATPPRTAAQTGLRKDGTPDMRTTLGKALAASPEYKTPSHCVSQGGGLGGLGGLGGFGCGGGGFGGGWSSGGGGGGGGPRCNNGSLDMRFAANRGMSKYG
jgi:hypothetical protein